MLIAASGTDQGTDGRDGLVMGAFHPRNLGPALYNPEFLPFRSPVPFLLMRRAVVGDWKFFLGDKDALDLGAARSGSAAVHALADEIHRLPWRTLRD